MIGHEKLSILLADNAAPEEPENWRLNAECNWESIETDIFFPEDIDEKIFEGRGMLTPAEIQGLRDEKKYMEKAAKAICKICVVKNSCLNDALANDPNGIETKGIRGGLTYRERNKLKRRNSPRIARIA